MDIRELNNLLKDKIMPLMDHLLPNGRREGQEWRVGGLDGAPGQSLGVHLTGPKTGLWCDFARGDKGDLIDLWRQVRGVSLATALGEVKSWLGVSDPVFHAKPVKTYARPSLPASTTGADAAAIKYLTTERKLTLEAIRAYQVTGQGREILFPSYRDGELIGTKFLGIERGADGKKRIRITAGQEPCLFGWQAIPPDARQIIICEGEIDALSWWQYGFPALSVPFGAGTGAKHAWIENEWPFLERFETIFLAFDPDEEGVAAEKDVSKRLGCERCLNIKTSFKDANECLQKGVTREAMAACITSAKPFTPEGLRNAGEFLDAVIERFYPPPGGVPGYDPPWKQYQGRLRYRPGELTIWTGYNGTGKSQALVYSALSAMYQGARVCLASLEMNPEDTLTRITKQATGLPDPSIAYIRQTIWWLSERLWLFDLVGSARVERLIEVFAYAMKRFGVDVFVVDSLMRLGIATDDLAGQEKAMLALVDFAVSKGVHIHLVAHARKSGNEGGAPGLQIKGAGALADNAFNIVEVWRNTDKEKKRELLKETGGDISSLDGAPDVKLLVQKQRNGDWTGTIPLWFHLESYQYHEGPGRAPLRWVQYAQSATSATN